MKAKSSDPDGRTRQFARNQKLEHLLAELNTLLGPAETDLLERYRMPAFPLVLVVGPHRSGTTLFMQWLANTRLVAYPTNLLSRFYGAPVIGAKIQLLLTDPRYSFRDELGEFSSRVEYASDNGKTKGVHAPNEFWYFWRRFLAEPGRDVWSDDELRQSLDIATMRAELAGIMDVFQKPFAAKGMLFNYNIPCLDAMFDQIVWVQIQRDPVTNVASALDATKRQLGSEAEWYSFKIPEYEQLSGLPALIQTAGQIHYINRAVSTGIAAVAEARKLVVDYEAFCADPAQVFSALCGKLGLGECPYDGPASFRVTRDSAQTDVAAISAALAQFDGR